MIHKPTADEGTQCRFVPCPQSAVVGLTDKIAITRPRGPEPGEPNDRGLPKYQTEKQCGECPPAGFGWRHRDAGARPQGALSESAIVACKTGLETETSLPAPVSVRSRVTAAVQPVAALTFSFRVVAACRRKGKLNPLLSVEATAQADGTFELRGLTPGTY